MGRPRKPRIPARTPPEALQKLEFATATKTRVRRRHHRAPKPVSRFPGEAAWQWHVQLRVERILSPVRVLVLAISAAAWTTLPHPANSLPSLARLNIILASVYAIVNVVLIYRFPRVLARGPFTSTILDALFTAGWLYATGGPNSQFLMLSLVGAASAPMHNPPRIALSMSVVYALMLLLLAGPGHWYDALYVLGVGAGLTVWSAVMYRDRRNSLRDDLTGSFTREYADFRLNDVYGQAAFPIALAVIDLDGFKAVNDTFGHPAGDAVLVQAVRAITAAIRQGDLLARSGGDEFVLILPRTTSAAAKAVAERVRSGIEFARLRHRRDLPPVRLTASIGVAVTEDARTASRELIKRADDLLYVAKESGRNRVAMG